MAILSSDIKLVASQVMADVPEGGGLPTGVEIVDGASNNLFPDTSTDDRAAGRVSFRKVFGTAQSNNTDLLLGASFAVLSAPADPSVHVTLFETQNWSDTRNAAQQAVERYVVKGPRLTCRVMDTHYAGARQLQLYQSGGSGFPSPGEAVALVNPNGSEQYVRVTKVTISTGNFNVTENGSVTTINANMALCDLAAPLTMDVLGPPVARVLTESGYAQIYSTTLASGAAFYGVKPLGTAASIGDRSVLAKGGMYTPIVPAATIEEPLVDIAPLLTRTSLGRTAQGTLTLPAQTVNLQPGTVLLLPTAIEPASLGITRGASVFTDDGNGNLKDGGAVVGAIDYMGQKVQMSASAPNYGNASTTIAYKPATLGNAAAHSNSIKISLANQGLSFTAVLMPKPAPGTLTIGYMAQGRWYDLIDNGNGKLAGADSSYGSGSVNYSTGSIAYTLGAVPDVGSDIIYGWGDSASAQAVDSGGLPATLQGTLPVNWGYVPGTLTLAWSKGGANYTATAAIDGTLTGDATGTVAAGKVTFAPSNLPDGQVTLNYATANNRGQDEYSQNGSNITLLVTPVRPGSFAMRADVNSQAEYIPPTNTVQLKDDGAGKVVWGTQQVGTIDYATGAVALSSPTITFPKVYKRKAWMHSYSGSWAWNYHHYSGLESALNVAFTLAVTAGPSGLTYVTDADNPVTQSVSVSSWGFTLAPDTGLKLETSGVAFACGSDVYVSKGGTLYKGWNPVTGTGTAAGTVSSSGSVTITSLPATSAIAWINAAQDIASPQVGQGVFRVASAPIKAGVFQLRAGELVGTASDNGTISGSGWSGTIDYQRGIVRWSRTGGAVNPFTYEAWAASNPIAPEDLRYNAVFLQYVPMDGALLGLETARLPLDGKVPIYRAGGQVLIHNTLSTELPNPVVLDAPYSLGRERIAAVQVRALGNVRVPDTKYSVDFSAGTVTFAAGADLAGLDQPFTVQHRIEDELMVLRADMSGRLDLVAGITHNYPADTSFVSSKLRKGDLFARTSVYINQSTWTGVWSDALIGSAPTASYNKTDYPAVVTNRGAVTERWAIIFTNTTQVRVVGESIGQVLSAASTAGAIEPINPQTGAPYFSLPALGWGGGWTSGNVLRINTVAATSPAWVARTVLPGPPTVQSDSATIAFRADVDA